MITAKGNVRRMLASAKCLGSLSRATMRASISRFLILVMVSFIPLSAAAQLRVLVYTRNYTPDGKGYVHDNIASSVAAIRKMGTEAGFAVDASDDPAVFTDGNLRQYAALVFANSNNQAFSDDAQRDAFRHYIEAGGGFVGLH